MSNDMLMPGGPAMPTYLFEAEAPCGTITWKVCQNIYGCIPPNERTDLFNAVGKAKIQPFFKDLAERFLRHVGSNLRIDPEGEPESSFTTVSIPCSDESGYLNWVIDQKLWDQIPDDSRFGLLSMAQVATAQFLTNEIHVPLLGYGFRRFHE